VKNGLYTLASLDGSPLDRRHVGPLFSGFSTAPDSTGSFVAVLADPHPDAAARHDDGPCTDLFLGHIDEPGEMRRRLGLAAGASHAEIAGAAQDRWGVEASRELGGEWTLLRWNGRTRTLILLMSECRRDDCYFAVWKGQVAIAPELVRLAKLDGIDGSFDPDALTRVMGRYPLDRSLGHRTFVRGVQRLLPGTQVTLRSEGSVTETLPAPAAPLVRAVSFDEAVHEIEALLRRIVRRRLADGRDAAFMLSGGLDSSLLVWLASEERRPGQGLHLLSSAAPAGSGIPDETGWAATVADHLGFSLIPVRPGLDADPYAPSEQMLASREGPLQSPRHYLYEALERAAVANGAATLFDGVYGELTVSNPGQDVAANTSWPRRLARGLRNGLAPRRTASDRGRDLFHVRLSEGLLESSGRSLLAGQATGRTPGRQLIEPFGYAPGWEKSAFAPTVIGDPAVRYVLPFRAPALLARFGTLPTGFISNDGVPRAIGRAVLRGRLPDRIVSRTSKMPFSPTYATLLMTHANIARERLVVQREAGAAEWLDLDWLDQALASVAGGKAFTTTELFGIQATAVAAEFFRWWRDQNINGR
jgi:asparagine synthase (glutamine-hydrolysing)